MQFSRQIPNGLNRLKSSFYWIPAFMLLCCLAISAQQPQTAEPQASVTEAKQQRHDQLVADTAKLLELANELKAEVDKSTKDTLSVLVVKKAEEVSKLAKKLREEMKP
jgi:hypothetical protein